MADIELVIKIPEEIRYALINNIQLSQEQQSISDSYIKQAIINGTPLPKENEKKDLSKRVEALKRLKLLRMKKEKEEQLKKLKDELDYAKFLYSWYLACSIAESEDEDEAVTDKNIYQIGDRVEVVSRSSRHNGKHGVIERVLYKVRFDDGSDSAFVESSLAKAEESEDKE